MILRTISFAKKYSTKVNKPFFITTPIFYVNASPHIGHLYSAVISDAIFRFQNLIDKNPKSIFSTGTDEHGSKIQQAALKNNIPVNNYCDNISKEYNVLFNATNVNYTDYVRTTQERHKTAVKHFWNLLKSKGHIYSTKYSGWYCIPDETFLTESQLKEKNGIKVSEESGHPVEWTEEVNYMFKLSKFQDEILYWIKSGDRIKPKKFEKILLDWMQEPLPDISVSRPTSRVHWGIRVPEDDSQTVYVWLDALVNYLTCAGYPNAQYQSSWPPSLHVIGKDILKFHGIYWPAFLLAAGLEPPKQLLVHSHWTVDDKKMSKSKFNVVDPLERSKIYTSEGMRYFLLREGVAHSDGNYSDTKLLRILNSELADTLGNLLSRGCAKTLNPKQVFPKIYREHYEELIKIEVTKKLIDLVTELPEKCHQHYSSYNFYLVVDQVISVLHTCNNFFETLKPWELKKGSIDDLNRLETIISVTLETLRVCGIILQPIIPELSEKLLNKLNVESENRNWSDLNNFLWEENCETEKKLGDVDPVLFRRIILEKNVKK